MTSNAVALFGGSKISLGDKNKAMRAMQDSASHDPRGGGVEGADYLNFSGKRGVYELGMDKLDVNAETGWIVNIHSFEDGWICWKGGQPVAKRLASIYADAPIPRPADTEFGPFDRQGEGWMQAKSFVAMNVETGQLAQFSTNSKSGVSSVAGLQKQIGARMTNGDGSVWPAIYFDKEKFTAQGNTNYKPIFPVALWLSDEVVHEALQDEDGTDLDALASLQEKYDTRTPEDDIAEEDAVEDAEVEEEDDNEEEDSNVEVIPPEPTRKPATVAPKTSVNKKKRRLA